MSHSKEAQQYRSTKKKSNLDSTPSLSRSKPYIWEKLRGISNNLRKEEKGLTQVQTLFIAMVPKFNCKSSIHTAPTTHEFDTYRQSLTPFVALTPDLPTPMSQLLDLSRVEGPEAA
ncbi:hypothetical protein Rs2_09530 [Raphanus sativus]|nr:hypothetical protein Rs2_09530 [Raphanus sativus]